MSDHFVSIKQLSDKLIQDFLNDNLRSGVNGPYDDQETELRNLSHLIVITAIKIHSFNEMKYIYALERMGNELINSLVNNVAVMRVNNQKDLTNGVIGNSWIIEALVYLYKTLKDNKYIYIASKIFFNHNFDEELLLWKSPNIQNKQKGKVDFTLNHQLWFYAASLELNSLLNDELIQNRLDSFESNLKKIIKSNFNGRLSHVISYRINSVSKIKQLIKTFLNKLQEFLKLKSYKYKEDGYQIFNFYALARIYLIKPNLDYFQSKKFLKSLDFTFSKYLFTSLINSNQKLDISLNNPKLCDSPINYYGFLYNVPGFEMPYINAIFKLGSNGIVEKYINAQMLYTYDNQKEIFGKNCFDKQTINYRIYELFKYFELDIDEDKI